MLYTEAVEAQGAVMKDLTVGDLVIFKEDEDEKDIDGYSYMRPVFYRL